MYLKIFSVLSILAVGACAFGKSHQKAIGEWRRNEKIIEAGIRGNHSDTDEYLRSVIFLVSLLVYQYVATRPLSACYRMKAQLVILKRCKNGVKKLQIFILG